MTDNSPKENIDARISVNQQDIEEAESIENDMEAMLRLIDYIFFLRDDDLPS